MSINKFYIDRDNDTVNKKIFTTKSGVPFYQEIVNDNIEIAKKTQREKIIIFENGETIKSCLLKENTDEKVVIESIEESGFRVPGFIDVETRIFTVHDHSIVFEKKDKEAKCFIV